MFKEIEHLIKIRNKSLTNKIQQETELTKENEELYKENKNLRTENEEIKLIFNEMIREIYSNLKTEEQKITKLKELITDYQA